jgi:co-chaperonin GroES (HSP10)
MKEYGIPKIPYLPAGKTILVFRLEGEEKTAGGLLYVPDEHREVKDIGVLLAAGLGARDFMAEHLVDIGDICWFGRFAGREQTIDRQAGTKGQKILSMKIEDLVGSVDALERVKDYDIKIDNDPESESFGQHFYVMKQKEAA